MKCHTITFTLACLGALSTGIQAQTPQMPPAKTMPAGEWKFDGTQWQFQDGSAVLPPQPQPGPGTTPTYPPGGTPYPQPYPKTTYPTAPYTPSYTPTQPSYTSPSVKVQVSTPIGTIVYAKPSTSAGVAIANSPGLWLVSYKKKSSDAWHYYAGYSTKSAAFSVADSLSHQGYWAAVTGKR